MTKGREVSTDHKMEPKVAGYGHQEALDLSLESLPGVGQKRGEVLREAKLHTCGDLLYHLPRRYLDRSSIQPIARAAVDTEVTLVGNVLDVSFVGGRASRLVLTLGDDSGKLTCTWFRGGRYLQRTFQNGDLVAFSGKLEVFRGRRQMVHPEFEFVADGEEAAGVHTGRIIPLYTTSADMKDRGLRSRGFRRLVRAALDQMVPLLEDPLAADQRARLGLDGLGESLCRIHFPDDLDQVKGARRRLAFDELFALQLRLARVRQQRLEQSRGISFPPSRDLVPRLLQALPFELTAAQHRVVAEIGADMSQSWEMRRLLQGDVGSGKTLVAACAMLTAAEAGYQAAMMVPTEILAEQHCRSLQQLLEPLGLRLALLLGGQSVPLRRELLTALAAGQAQIAVGTHALIQEGVEFANLGLAVVDEQHRFGVAQRAQLGRKGGYADALYMTATPIPRSLALSVYGDLDVSVIDELPPGRRPVRTAMRGAPRRPRVLEFAAEQIASGRQVYVVYPLVEESERSELAAAVAGYEELREGPLSNCSVGLLHGRMAGAEKAQIMEAFKKGEIQALVSTTVIEVGVDVPNATVMIIEHAERFGLAQLHQLRGRVGRGAEQSYCTLMDYEDNDGAESTAKARLQTLCQTQDGFEIADKDLRLRGPGEFFGTRQAGVPDLKVADLARDIDLMRLARKEADDLIRLERRPSA
jgi:ATP-dependent DNA helicase RecG